MENVFQAPFKFYAWLMSKSDPRTKYWIFHRSPFPILCIIFSYIYFVKVLGPKWLKNRPPLKNKKIILLYNVLMVLFSAVFFIYGGSFSYLPPWGKFSWICEPIDYSWNPETLKLVSVGWWYQLLKILEMADTIFFLLRKKFNNISTLHVVHHSLVVWCVWVVVKFGIGGNNLFFPLINCFVHIIMYSYYCAALLRSKKQKVLWWKKYVTIIQMVQFVLVFVHAMIPLFYDCGFPKVFACIYIGVAALFMMMFMKFYQNEYILNKKNVS